MDAVIQPLAVWNVSIPGRHDSAIKVYGTPPGLSSGSLSVISMARYSSHFPTGSAKQSTVMICWPPAGMDPNPGYTVNMPRVKRACRESKERQCSGILPLNSPRRGVFHSHCFSLLPCKMPLPLHIPGIARVWNELSATPTAF